jgi:hypothetical protein
VVDEFHGDRSGQYAFLFGSDALPKANYHRPASTNFSGFGLAVLRSGDSMMTFHYGEFHGHGHFDKMSLTLMTDKRLWAADYGTPGYGSAILPWYRSTLSHNTIVVDGKSQAPTDENKARAWLDDPGLEAVRATTREAYPGVTFSRTVMRIGNYFVVKDELESDRQHTYDFYLHSEGELSLSAPPGKFRNIKPAVKWIQNLVSTKSGNDASASWRTEGHALNAAIMADRPMEIMKGECPAESGVRLIPLLIARQTEKKAEFITVLSSGHDGDVSARWNGAVLSVSHDKTTDLISFKADGHPSLRRQAN